jgi:HPt (histidine-containing phosphotransfer) domain-containing protein
MEDLQYDKASVAQEMELPLEFMDELIEELFMVVNSDIEKLDIGFKNNNQEDIKFALHSIKGAVANLRMDKLVTLIVQYEDNLSNHIQFSQDDYDTLIKLIDTYKKGLL